jgi:phospholipid/cholesterol/gamma-HCH transport system substrate-binding protein
VQINGLKIGQITQISFHPDNSGRIMVVFEVSSDYPIPSNSVALIHSISLLGENVIALELGNSFDMALSGDTLASGTDGNLSDAVYEQIAPLKAKAEKLLNTLDTAVSQLTGFLNDNTRQDFIKTFESLRSTFENLERTTYALDLIVENNTDSINQFVGNLTSISRTLKDNGENLDNILTNFSDLSDTIAKANVHEALISLNDVISRTDTIMTKIDRGDGSIGKLINDPGLYENLEEASNSLNRLILDIKYNPNKYVQVSVFGSKEQLSEEDIDKLEQKRKERRQELDEKMKEEDEAFENEGKKKDKKSKNKN